MDYLIDYAHSKGLKFGLWIEPEMVNPESELAEKHPEWIVQSPGREKIVWRNQLLLDLSNPKVQDFVYSVFDSLLTVITSYSIHYTKLYDVMKDCLNLMGLNVGHPVKPIDHCTAERMDALKVVLKDLQLLNE